MTKKTKKTLMIGAGVTAVGVVDYLYWKSKQPVVAPTVPAAPVTPVVPAATP
jgi:hypothetical protein